MFPETLGVPRQEILPVSAWAACWRFLRASEAELAGALSAAAGRGFDLSCELPLRAHLFALSAHEHVLLLALHHIAGDGWSLGPLVRDLGAFYRARRDGVAAELAALPVQYADYTLWQRAVLGDETDQDSAIARQLAYWTGRWRDCRSSLIFRPTGRVPRCRAMAGAALRLRLRPELHRASAGACAGERRQPVHGAAGGVAALLTRLGAGTDIALGSPIAGRTDSALDELVGFFVNTLVLRTDTSGQPGIAAS